MNRQLARRTQSDRVAESTRLLMQAALELFAKQGYEATSVGAIADRAGYARSLVNARFGGKEGLVAALLNDRWVGELLAGLSDEPDGLAVITTILDRLMAMVVEQPVRLRATMVLSFEAAAPAALPPQLVTVPLAGLDAILVASIRRGQAEGVIAASLDAQDLALRIVEECIGALYRWVVDPGYDVAARIAAMRARLLQPLGSVAVSHG